MGFFGSLTEGIRNHFDRKKEDRAMMDKLRKEAEMERQVAFEIAFREDAKKVAIAKAKKDAARLSGLKKMTAQNRLRNLTKTDQAPDSVMAKFSAFTQKNIAKREENLKATEERRKEAEKIREQRLEKIANRSMTRKPFR